MNDDEFNQINAIDAVNVETLRLLVDNLVRVSEARGATIHLLVPAQWGARFVGRIGMEPLFKLIWIFIKAVESSGSSVVDVMSHDPVLLNQCMALGDLQPYYDQYPVAARTPR